LLYFAGGAPGGRVRLCGGDSFSVVPDPGRPFRGRRRMSSAARTICIAAAIFVFGIRSADAQPGAHTLIFEGGGVRDVASSSMGETLYVASYASDEIIAIDPARATVLRRVKVDKGPAAIAVDSTGIAVLSRAVSSVSVLDTGDLSVRARVAVTPGTSVLFGAGASRVVALNPFASEVSVIDTRVGTVLKTVSLSGGIPVGGCFDGERIAIIGRTQPVVWWLDANTLDVLATSALPDAPQVIVSPVPGSFVIQVDRGMIRVDGTTHEAMTPVGLRAQSLSAFDGGVICIAGGVVRSYGPDLQEEHSWAIPEGAESARWVGAALFTWSPTLGRVWRVDAPGTPVISADAESGEAASAVVQLELAAVVDAPVEPAVAASVVVAESEPAPMPTAPPAPVEAPADATAPEAEPEYRFTIQPTRLGLGGFKPYAPHFGDPTGRTFQEAVAHALDVRADEDSLLSAEIPDHLDNLKFGGQLRSVGSAESAAASADGGVEFDLADVHVRTDSIALESRPRKLRMDGASKFSRGASVLEAESVEAFDTEPTNIPGFWPIVPSRMEKPVPHPLVPRGYKEPSPRSRPPLGTIEMKGLNWDETERRLTAERLELNTLSRRAIITNAKGEAGPLYFGADTLRIRGPGSAEAEDFWITTCDLPEPHYRVRVARIESDGQQEVTVTHARLQLGQADTPIYLPRYAASLAPGERAFGTELTIAGSTALGSYVNVAQWFRVTDSVDVAPRVYATAKQGIGFGFDSEYDFMKDPASPLFRSTGQLRTLYTTEQNGYTEWYHRQELTPDTVLLGQWEQWYERDVIKDFYNNDYENRTGPRSFLSVAHTRPEYMVAGTVAPSTHDFTSETEKLPELTFNMFERRLADGFYGTVGAVGGYYETQPETIGAGRIATLGRLSYDWNVARGFNVLPFVELDGTYYSQTLDESGDAFRGTATAGMTVQSRLQRSYPGLGNFTGFKHIVIPSTTISFTPDATLDAEETPLFDAIDKRPGRARVENTLDNILLGKNSVNGKVWPVARLTFYHGHDFENEAIKADDYEVDFEVRPRPAWGVRTVGEIHDVSNSSVLPGDDFNRLIAYAFYDNKLDKNTLNGRVGFAYTESGPGVLNQEVLYGVGYKIASKWSVAFEHRYDFELNEFTRQTYSIRRKLHDWEIALTVRDRQDSIDIGIQINLVDFPEIGAGL